MFRALSLLAVLSTALPLAAANPDGLDQKGKVPLTSATSLAFGPAGVLFVGDSQAAQVVAISTDGKSDDKANVNITKVDAKIAALLGTTADQILLNDIAANPDSGNIYVAVSRGKGPTSTPVIVKIDNAGKLTALSLDDTRFAVAKLPNGGTASKRGGPITDIDFVNNHVIVAGLSNEEFASNLRSIPFPFRKISGGSAIEIFHGAHGRFETRSPIRTFTHYEIDKQLHLLAAYTCTPLVKIPVKSLDSGKKIKGITIAELGNHNRPLDMIVYSQKGEDFLLIANSARGVMKVSTKNIGKTESITKRISGTAGLKYETIDSLTGVLQLAKLNDSKAIVLLKSDEGLSLKTVDLP